MPTAQVDFCFYLLLICWHEAITGFEYEKFGIFFSTFVIKKTVTTLKNNNKQTNKQNQAQTQTHTHKIKPKIFNAKAAGGSRSEFVRQIALVAEKCLGVFRLKLVLICQS